MTRTLHGFARRSFGLATLLLTSCAHVDDPAPTSISAQFMATSLMPDCVEMERRVATIGIWSATYRSERHGALVFHPIDELWVLSLYDIPPSRVNSPAHGLRALTLACGAQQRRLQALSCRNGHGLRLYVDPQQLSDWGPRGALAAACALEADVDGTRYRGTPALLLRPGLRERLAPIDPYTSPAEPTPTPPPDE